MSWSANLPDGTNIAMTANVCKDCPWRKQNRQRFHPYPAALAGIFDLVENGTVMACHMTQRELQAFPDEDKIRTCRGIEHFRANIEVSNKINPDPVTVFATKKEALKAWKHGTLPIDWDHQRRMFFLTYPDGEYIDENKRKWKAGKLVETP